MSLLLPRQKRGWMWSVVIVLIVRTNYIGLVNDSYNGLSIYDIKLLVPHYNIIYTINPNYLLKCSHLNSSNDYFFTKDSIPLVRCSRFQHTQFQSPFEGLALSLFLSAYSYSLLPCLVCNSFRHSSHYYYSLHLLESLLKDAL